MSKKGMKLMGGRCIINSRTLVDLIIKIKFICIFIFFLSYRSISAQDIPLSGLYFSSHEVIKDQRTSLNLSSNKTYNFSKGFTLEFDANFRRGDGHYGYIFRMIDDEKNNIDLVSNLASEIINFSLVLKDCTLISYRWQDIPNGDFDEWINVKVHVDPIRFQISLALNNYEKVKQFSSPIDFSRLNIVFGACNLPFFLNSDVSPMTIKDIRFYDNKQNLYRYWKLSKHGTENVYDEIENAPAEVKNPIWLINRHTQWKHLKKIQFNDLLGVAQNDATGQIYFVDKDAIFSYSSDSKVLDTINYLGGRPFHCKGSQVIFNVFTQELWSYNFDRGFINKFNFDNKKWSHSDSTCPEPDFWHHTKFL